MTQPQFETEQSTETRDFDYVPTGALSQVEAASINQAIATAHRFPRNEKRVKERMLALATTDTETAAQCSYELKRFSKKDGKTHFIRGESIRMAEIAASAWGNLDTGSRVVEILDGAGGGLGFVSCQGVAHDLEANLRTVVNVYSRITVAGPDGVMLAAAAGCSKALRNAILSVVPRAIVRTIAGMAADTAAGDRPTMEKRRVEQIGKFAEIGVTRQMLFDYLEDKTVEEIDIPKYKTMIALLTAIKDGQTTIAE